MNVAVEGRDAAVNCVNVRVLSRNAAVEGRDAAVSCPNLLVSCSNAAVERRDAAQRCTRASQPHRLGSDRSREGGCVHSANACVITNWLATARPTTTIASAEACAHAPDRFATPTSAPTPKTARSAFPVHVPVSNVATCASEHDACVVMTHRTVVCTGATDASAVRLATRSVRDVATLGQSLTNTDAGVVRSVVIASPAHASSVTDDTPI